MSYLENTAFSLVTIDPATGRPLSPEAIENRKRLILLWKIQNEKQAALASDLNDPDSCTEEALGGEAYLDMIRSLIWWGQQSSKFPILKIQTLEQLAEVAADKNETH